MEHTDNQPLVLICYAVEGERVNWHLPGFRVQAVKTGIGRACAAFHLTQAIMQTRPDFVLNVGTSGTFTHKVGDVLVCRRFLDRDFQPLALPGVEWEMEFPDALPLCLPSVLNGQVTDKNFTLSTGDDFVTTSSVVKADAVDMEAFAEAMVCREMGIPFVAVKYITDVVGQNSVKEWEERLADARVGLTHYFENLVEIRK